MGRGGGAEPRGGDGDARAGADPALVQGPGQRRRGRGAVRAARRAGCVGAARGQARTGAGGAAPAAARIVRRFCFCFCFCECECGPTSSQTATARGSAAREATTSPRALRATYAGRRSGTAHLSSTRERKRQRGAGARRRGGGRVRVGSGAPAASRSFSSPNGASTASPTPLLRRVAGVDGVARASEAPTRAAALVRGVAWLDGVERGAAARASASRPAPRLGRVGHGGGS